MQNKAMEKLLKSGDAIDLSGSILLGPWYTVDTDKVPIDDIKDRGLDFCDAVAEVWIWSIGRRLSDNRVFASTTPEFYENPEFECLWLR